MLFKDIDYTGGTGNDLAEAKHDTDKTLGGAHKLSELLAGM